MVIDNIVKHFLYRGASIHPLIIDDEETKGTGLTNPSVYVDGDDILLNLRHVQYSLYHTDGKFESCWGPLVYFNPESDITLRTVNYLCVINNETFEISSYNKVNTSLFDIEPVWEFIGLEDARVVRWDGNLYLSGVRRDVKPNGEGRMELSKIEISHNNVSEINRQRIPAPGENNSYCEKNWMPILDMPYHYIKWTNPTEVVEVNPLDNSCHRVYLGNDYYSKRDLRGGSQVITIGNYRLAITHEVDLWYNKQNHKQGTYRHRVVVWDKQWNVVNISEEFNFMGGLIEFCTGLAIYKDDVLISFGYEDNAAYLLRIPLSVFTSYFIPEYKNDSFPKTYCISYEKNQERRNQLINGFNLLNLPDPEFFITNEEMDKENKITGQFIYQSNEQALNVAASHLKAIKKWYENNNEPYALFLEDDISLSTVPNWGFQLNEFIDKLPNDWSCVQLLTIRDRFESINLRERKWDDWGATAYLITRSYAKKILDEYDLGNNTYDFTIKRYPLIPLVENLIYDLDKTYCCPLFVENINFTSTFYTNNVIVEEHKTDHIFSSNYVSSWWRENNKYPLDKLINNE